LLNCLGDFSIVFYDNLNKKCFISKDLFGKKSLMMGFTKNGFVVSSAALGIKNPDNEKEDDTDLGDEKEDFLEGKYMNDFLNNF